MNRTLGTYNKQGRADAATTMDLLIHTLAMSKQ